jgi:hypothetical protein
MGYETWCFVCNLETKQQSSEWVGEKSPRPKKMEFERFHIKDMLLISLTFQGVVHKEFIPDGRTVNAEFYKGIMDYLLKHIQQDNPSAFCSRNFFCCTIMRPPTKLQVFANFFFFLMLQTVITPCSLQIYLH